MSQWADMKYSKRYDDMGEVEISNSLKPSSTHNIKISSADQSEWYPLTASVYTVDEDEKLNPLEMNSIDSYTLSGGPQVPFEYVKLSIPRKKLIECSTSLVNNGIIPGRNKLSIDYFGKCKYMTITKCKTTSDMVTLVAYCDAEILRGRVTTGAFFDTPFEIIKQILTSSDYLTRPFSSSGDDDGTASFIYCYDTKLNDTIGNIEIPSGENVWVVLQICAIALGCKIFFASDNAYLLDYRIAMYPTERGVLQTSGWPPFYECEGQNLMASGDNSALYGRIIDKPKLGDEGLETVTNTVVLRGKESLLAGTSTVIEEDGLIFNDQNSVSHFGEYAEEIDTRYLTVKQRAYFAQSYLDYRKEPQQSISFTVNELLVSENTVVWSPLFSNVTRMEGVYDAYNDIQITNDDAMGNPAPQKFYLSSFERNYPDGTTTYTFGMIEQSDLSQMQSQIRTAIGK